MNLTACLGAVPRVASAQVPESYTVRGPFFTIKQPKPKACWATATTMLFSWKAASKLQITEVLDQAGPAFKPIYEADTGIGSDEKRVFIQALGLQVEPPATPTLQGLVDALRRFGPLWITTQETAGTAAFLHSRVLTGVLSNADPAQSMLLIADPADGKTHTESLSQFLAKQADVARSDYGGGADVRPILVHLP